MQKKKSIGRQGLLTPWRLKKLFQAKNIVMLLQSSVTFDLQYNPAW